MNRENLEAIETAAFILCLDQGTQNIKVSSAPEHHLIPERVSGSIPELTETLEVNPQKSKMNGDVENSEESKIDENSSKNDKVATEEPSASSSTADYLPLSNSMQTPSFTIDEIESKLGLQMLHGGGSSINGINRWFDKTMQFVIARDGNCGLNYEHSPAEGIAVIRLIEHILHYMYYFCIVILIIFMFCALQALEAMCLLQAATLFKHSFSQI